MGLIQRFNDWVTFVMSVMVTGIGVMTVSEKMALAGLMLGIFSGWRSWLHRSRIEQAETRRNELIAQLVSQSDRRSLTTKEREALKMLGGDDEAC